MLPFIDQTPLTVIATIDPMKEAALRLLLQQIEEDMEANSIIPFKQIPGVHFARFVILPAFTSRQGVITLGQLAYSTNIDGSLEDHLGQILIHPLLKGFYQVFSCCQGFNHTISEEKAVQAFILAHRQKVHTFYRGHRGLSVKQIHQEYEVYKQIQTYLDSTLCDHVAPEEIKKGIEQHLATSLAGWQPPPAIRLRHLSIVQAILVFLALPLLIVLVTSALLGAFWPTLAIIVLALFVAGSYLRYLEKNAVQMNKQVVDYTKVTQLTEREDKVVQNQLTHLVELQPGVFRRTCQQFALWLLNLLAKYSYNQGRLGDIATIHFARWLLIDGGKRLIFFSNFDGSWENYLGDFVDRAAPGLTLAWSNTHEFPTTKFLIQQGATDEERFKEWARVYQIPTQVWYSAYKDLTVKNILRNHAIARGIGQSMNTKQLQEWLTLL